VRLAALALALVAAAACTAADTLRAPPTLTETVTTPTPTPQLTEASGAPPGLEQAWVTRVVDGDTIDVLLDGETLRVRYIGIDTPETVDPRRPVGCFGREASDRNRALVEGQTVGLERDVSDKDDFGRLLRYVWIGSRMVNAALVEDGYALASTYPPDVKHANLFAALQSQAREAARGLWSACATPEPPPPAGGACEHSATDEPVIKGNISYTTGEKIYHVPGGEFYEATVIDEATGERWFCTEAEAVAAGWRKSKR
jgi:micrococcal nuclease